MPATNTIYGSMFIELMSAIGANCLAVAGVVDLRPASRTKAAEVHYFSPIITKFVFPAGHGETVADSGFFVKGKTYLKPLMFFK